MVDSIRGQLELLASDVAARMPTTLLFVEIPTNPAMKVPDVTEVADMLRKYKDATGKAVHLMIDATFAPNSKVLAKFKELIPDLSTLVFLRSGLQSNLMLWWSRYRGIVWAKSDESTMPNCNRSMSKSVSRGLTTAGAIVANHTDEVGLQFFVCRPLLTI